VLEETAKAAVEACCKNWRLDGISQPPAEPAQTGLVSPILGIFSKRLPEAASIYDLTHVTAREKLPGAL
jgi:hypothetical protein